MFLDLERLDGMRIRRVRIDGDTGIGRVTGIPA